MSRKLACIAVLVFILVSCSPTVSTETISKSVETPKEIHSSTIEPTSIPSPPSLMPASTPVPPEISEAAKQTYLAMLLIQINSRLVEEAASRTQAGELTGFDQLGVLLAIAV
jgi:PBP1b-binding outer membrane lipoprotein LpoB